MEFRDYQLEMIKKAKPLLEKDRFVYLAMEVRTGKTLTSLGVSALLPVQNLLFITKKKAIGSIEDDYKMLNPSYKITTSPYIKLIRKVGTWWCVMSPMEWEHSLKEIKGLHK